MEWLIHSMNYWHDFISKIDYCYSGKKNVGLFCLMSTILMFIIDICCCMYVYDEMSHFRWNLKILYLKINCLVADISVAFLCCWEWLIWVNQAAEHLTKNWYDFRLCTFNQYFKLPLFLENVEVVCEMRRWIRIYWLFQLVFHLIDEVYSYWIIILVNNIWYQFMKV